MSAISINHINIRAPADLLASLRDFYCNALGLQVGERPGFASQGYWLYSGHHALIHLSVCKKDEIRAVNVQNTLDHVAFTSSDQVAMCNNLTAMGVKFTTDLVPGRQIHQVFFYDPSGNGVELSFVESD